MSLMNTVPSSDGTFPFRVYTQKDKKKKAQKMFTQA